MTKYSAKIEQKMELYFSQLSEKDKRYYAGVEAEKLGYGGKSYISLLFKISRTRIDRGIQELADPKLYGQIPDNKQRREGGGRKKKR